jgi:tetratricopeptide (TPR) repeat protein
MRRHGQLVGTVLVAMLIPDVSAAGAQERGAAQPAQLLNTLAEYFALAERARNGGVEGAVVELRTWNWHAFRDLRDALARSRQQLEGPSQRILNKWARADIEALAMLHTEAAIRSTPLSTEEISHANWAKQLLELFDGLRVDQTFRRQWYVAWGAHLQSELRLRELSDHVDGALRKWPTDTDLLTMAGTMYESWFRRAAVTPGSDYIPMQSRLQRDRPDRQRSQRLAESYYRRALAAHADLFDARLRLGRMLLDAKRIDDALAHVTEAVERAASPRERYVALLFLGRVHASAGRWPDAAAAYSDADGVLTDCQSAMLGSSSALLKQGARDEAIEQIKVALQRTATSRCDDPWWAYSFGYGPRTDALLEQLRERLRP